MSDTRQHPAPEQLDRLRAGLLDDKTELVAVLEQHISGCMSCQRHLDGWTRLQELMEPSEQDQAVVASQLKKARQAAFRPSASAGNRFMQPALAVAASLVLVIGLVVWNPWSPLDTTQDQMAQHQEESAPDIYEDLDFYLWLAGHQESAVSTTDTKVAKT